MYNLKEEKDEEIVVSLDEDNGDNGYKWISKSEGTKLEQQKKRRELISNSDNEIMPVINLKVICQTEPEREREKRNKNKIKFIRG